MANQNNSTIMSKLASEAGLVLIPFFFTLIVFMFKVGKFFFYDIPLEHISVSLGELFSFWFGFFIAVGVLGFAFINLIVGIIKQGKSQKFFNVVLYDPLLYGLVIFLISFPLAPFKASLLFAGGFFLVVLLQRLWEALFDKNKQFNFWERIVSNTAKARYKEKAMKTDPASLWDKVNESYYLGIFCVYVFFGFPIKIGYLLESSTTRHWVDNSKQELILVQTQNEFHLLKEYDPKDKTFKPGYVIRPVADAELRYIEVTTGEIKKIELDDKAVFNQSK